MDTRFEVNIKKVSVKGDNKALYLYINNSLLLKLAYSDIESAIKFLLTKAKLSQIESHEREMLACDCSEEE